MDFGFCDLDRRKYLILGRYGHADFSQHGPYWQSFSKNLAVHLSVKIRVHLWQNAFFLLAKSPNRDRIVINKD